MQDVRQSANETMESAAQLANYINEVQGNVSEIVSSQVTEGVKNLAENIGEN